MNPFVSRITGNSWVLPVSGLSLVLGFMMTLAWIDKTNRAERLKLLSPDVADRFTNSNLDRIEATQKVSEEVGKLRADNTKLQNALASQNSSSKVLNDSLQEAKMFAGLTEVEGPGVTVTLRDSTKPMPAQADPRAANIHDGDVLQVVNVLWHAGAEAICVNKHRIITRSSFTCVGLVILVDGTPIASPVVIQAIGDPETLKGALNTRQAILDQIRHDYDDPNMVELASFQKARLPAYAGSTAFKYAVAAKEKK